MFADRNDYATTPARRAVRSLLARSGLDRRLGPWWWRPTTFAPYLKEIVARDRLMFDGMPTDFVDPAFAESLRSSTAQWRRYRETITAADNATVEPNRCQVIGPDGRMVRQFDVHPGQHVYPSAWQHARRRIAHRFDEAIVFDGSAGRNYYHFLVDSLAGLAWLDEEPGQLDTALPFIVNRRIADHPFFRHLRTRSERFDRLDWRILERGEFALVRRAYRLNPAPFRPELWRRIRNYYGRSTSRAGKRLFISRDSLQFGRSLSNEPEVIGVLQQFGFETVYFEHLAVGEQQALMEQADHVVALQGMALIQQFFMAPATAAVLELMPASRLQTEYAWQGWTLGQHSYDVQLGTVLDARQRYAIDPVRLACNVQAMLELPADRRRFGQTLLPATAA